MKERGILFSAPMVLALLDGSKLQTRRIVKDPPRHWSERLYIRDGSEAWEPSGYTKIKPSHDGLFIRGVYPIGSTEPAKPSPYGVVGDRLWVRETWGFDAGIRGDFEPMLGRYDLRGEDLLRHTLYRASGGEPPRWRSPRFMPRWASRITLEITEVRAERLQSISEEDAKAEGVSMVPFYPDDGLPLSQGFMVGADDGKTSLETSAVKAFAKLWDAINGKRAPWEFNPWLWVISFKRLTP